MNSNYKVIQNIASDATDTQGMIDLLVMAKNKLILLMASTDPAAESISDHAFYKESQLKDGQTDSRVIYRSAADLMNDIKMIDRQINALRASITGRVTILRSGNL